jgi:LPS sulfotransferase NodH
MRAEPSMIKPRFVILAAPRSGSNLLCTLLGSHPAILCHHEIFNPAGIRVALELRGTEFLLGTLDERQRDPLAFLDAVWAAPLGHACVGFKLTHRQNEPVFRHLLADTGVAKIVLRRQNRMKTYVSQRISEALVEWEVYRHEDLRRDRPRVHIEPEQFLDRVRFDEAYYDEIRQALAGRGHEWIEVRYESLFSGDQQRAILDFLGLDPIPGGLRSGSIKQNSRDLRDLVANYDELLRHFGGTPFEAELTDCQD